MPVVATDAAVESVPAYRRDKSSDIDLRAAVNALVHAHDTGTSFRFFNKTDADSGFLEALPSLQDPVVCEHLPRPREQQ